MKILIGVCIFLINFSYLTAQELPYMNRANLGREALKQPYTDVKIPGVPQKDPEGKYDKLLQKTPYVVTAQVANMTALLFLTPRSFSKFPAQSTLKGGTLLDWEKASFHSPVVDKDSFLVNSSHAFLAGAGYHAVCRAEGYDFETCFAYDTIMSTLHEFMIETFAGEKASVQDLFVTPIGGAIIGEIFHQLGIPHPLTLLVKGMEHIAGSTIKAHNIRVEIGYGSVNLPSITPENHHLFFDPEYDRHREMGIRLKGNF